MNITNPFDLGTQDQLDVLQNLYVPWLKETKGIVPTQDKLTVGKYVAFNGLADDLYVFLRHMYKSGKLSYDGIIVNEGLTKVFDEEFDASISYVPLFKNQIKLISNKFPTNKDSIYESKHFI